MIPCRRVPHRWKVNHALEVTKQHPRGWGQAGGLRSRSSDQHVVRLQVTHAHARSVASINRLRGQQRGGGELSTTITTIQWRTLVGKESKTAESRTLWLTAQRTSPMLAIASKKSPRVDDWTHSSIGVIYGMTSTAMLVPSTERTWSTTLSTGTTGRAGQADNASRLAVATSSEARGTTFNPMRSPDPVTP